jgi:hypothetical protein
MLLGTAKECITPPVGTWMDGYGFRIKPCESISEDIYIRVHVHRFPERKIVYIYGDVASWGNEFVKESMAVLKKLYGLENQELFYIASHSHSGPVIGHESLLNVHIKENESYTAYVLSQISKAVGEALEEQIPVTMTRYNGSCAINVFRRILEDGEIIMEPNYNVPADHHLTVLVMRDEEGEIRGIMVHYPCHANFSKGYDIQPDYPGIALRMLDEAYPKSLSIFMQGCTGDLRPNSVCGDRFVPAPYDKVLTVAGRFVHLCQNAMETRGIPVSDGLSVSTRTAELPLEGLKTKEELKAIASEGTEQEKMWANRVLSEGNRPYTTLLMSLIRYGSGLSIYMINAEVVQDYATYARTIDPDIICTAYANGMIGYLPTAEEIVEGGYEPKESAPGFGLAGTFRMEADRIIRSTMQELYKG